jgi:hypothetical protein
VDADENKRTDQEGVIGLAGFFDLLARFDFEDKKKEQSVLNTGSLVSAPRESVLGSET